MGILNVFKIKKLAALLFCAFLPTILFLFGMQSYGFIYALGFFAAGAALAVLLANKLLANPFTDMLEGKGLLVLTLDSTGIIPSFIARIVPPKIEAKFMGKEIHDFFDRNIIHYFKPPIPAQVIETTETVETVKEDGSIEKTEEDVVIIKLPKKNEADSIMSLNQYPTLIYNKNLQTFLTKEQLATLESEVFIDHTVLYLLKKVEELTNSVRDFTRYIVDQSKPGLLNKLLSSSWVMWLIIAVVIIVVGILLFPMISETWATAAGSVAQQNPHAINPR